MGKIDETKINEIVYHRLVWGFYPDSICYFRVYYDKKYRNYVVDIYYNERVYIGKSKYEEEEDYDKRIFKLPQPPYEIFKRRKAVFKRKTKIRAKRTGILGKMILWELPDYKDLSEKCDWQNLLKYDLWANKLVLRATIHTKFILRIEAISQKRRKKLKW